MYTVESRGELLVVRILVKTDSTYYKDFQRHGRAGDIESFARALSVSVYAVRVEGGKLQWERGTARAWPNSFAMDAAQLGMSGGCVYFIDRRPLYGGDLEQVTAGVVSSVQVQLP